MNNKISIYIVEDYMLARITFEKALKQVLNKETGTIFIEVDDETTLIDAIDNAILT